MFEFDQQQYTVLENIGASPVIVVLSGGILERSVVLTVTPSNLQATGL